MLIRKEIELREEEYLSPYAALAKKSKGRGREEEQCDIRTCYQRDRDRITHSKSFRRLKDKTQVFLSPQGDHYRTRLMHTLEVSQIARTISKALHLNDDLVEAIALGHDLGHTPFGHAGERALRSVCPFGFSHSEQSIRVVEVIEKGGKGLNLSWEVKDGILNHSLSKMPSTLEGKVVRLSDKIAYIHHDMDDALRAGLLSEEDVPEKLKKILGYSVKDRLNTFVHDVVTNSYEKNEIAMSDDIYQALIDIRQFMFDHLYTNHVAKKEEGKARELLVSLYGFYNQHTDKLGREYLEMYKRGETKERVVCDYISGMTDQYSIAKFNEYFVPRSWERY